MGMIYEELISRLNPRYLLSVSVLLMMGTQMVNFGATTILGMLFNYPSKELTIQLLWCMAAMYFSLIVINVVVAFLNTKDNDRKSVISRFMRKREALEEWKNKLKRTFKIGKGKGDDMDDDDVGNYQKQKL